jgi:hypothetical protein
MKSLRAGVIKEITPDGYLYILSCETWHCAAPKTVVNPENKRLKVGQVVYINLANTRISQVRLTNPFSKVSCLSEHLKKQQLRQVGKQTIA